MQIFWKARGSSPAVERYGQNGGADLSQLENSKYFGACYLSRAF
jgi:hypothetical protein